jgi:hypothetical protein
MPKRRPVRGTIQGVVVRSKVVSDALTEAKAAVDNLQAVNRDLGRRLAAEQEVSKTVMALECSTQRALMRERVSATTGWWLAAGFGVAWLVTVFVRVVG